jgi:hypothetical protein
MSSLQCPATLLVVPAAELDPTEVLADADGWVCTRWGART